MPWSRASHAFVVVGGAVLALAGCWHRTKRCHDSTSCPGQMCVVGRCRATVGELEPSLAATERRVFRPVDLGYVRGDATDDADSVSPVVALGGGRGALLLRFAASWPASSKVVAAYVVLRRAVEPGVQDREAHLLPTRITEPWRGRSRLGSHPPSWVDVGAPVTRVSPGGPSLVRLDVREVVRFWPRGDAADHGVAVVAIDDEPSGLAIATTRGALTEELATAPVEPFLEVYLRHEAGPRPKVASFAPSLE